MEDTLPNFSEKIVYVFFESKDPNAGAAVENPRFEIQGGRLFLIGRGFTAHAWGADFPVAIAWSTVRWYSVFDSVEEFGKAKAFKGKITKSFWGSKHHI